MKKFKYLILVLILIFIPIFGGCKNQEANKEYQEIYETFIEEHRYYTPHLTWCGYTVEQLNDREFILRVYYRRYEKIDKEHLADVKCETVYVVKVDEQYLFENLEK